MYFFAACIIRILDNDKEEADWYMRCIPNFTGRESVEPDSISFIMNQLVLQSPTDYKLVSLVKDIVSHQEPKNALGVIPEHAKPE